MDSPSSGLGFRITHDIPEPRLAAETPWRVTTVKSYDSSA